MQFMNVIILSVFAVFFVSCTKKSSTQDQAQQPETQEQRPAPVSVKKEPDFSKPLREAIYFSSSLEREALKLILKNPSLQKTTLFSSLAFIVEINSGAKKSTPFGLDCGTYDIKRENNKISIFKSCVKPAPKVADIDIIRPDESYKVHFYSNEWPSVLGMSVSLTGSDIACQISLKEKKLQKLECENWSYQVSEDQLSSTVLKANEFKFQRDSARQFVIKGSFLKELVENRKFDVVVPLEGKITIIEKEVQVIDEFLEEINRQNDGGLNGEKETGEKENPSQESQQEEGGRPQNRGEANREEENRGQENFYQEQPNESINSQEEGFSAPGLEFQEVYPENQQPEQQEVPVQPVPTRGRGR